MTYDDTLTDAEFVSALRESPLASFDGAARPEPDFSVEGLHHSLASRLVALFLPKGPG